MDELVEFLRAALDRDERFAQRAAAVAFGHPLQAPWAQARLRFRAADGNDADLAVGVFADPARVLAEVEAKRRMLAEYEEALAQSKELRDTPHSIQGSVRLLAALRFVKLLAQPYAGQDGWREEWRAEADVDTA